MKLNFLMAKNLCQLSAFFAVFMVKENQGAGSGIAA